MGALAVRGKFGVQSFLTEGIWDDNWMLSRDYEHGGCAVRSDVTIYVTGTSTNVTGRRRTKVKIKEGTKEGSAEFLQLLFLSCRKFHVYGKNATFNGRRRSLMSFSEYLDYRYPKTC